MVNLLEAPKSNTVHQIASAQAESPKKILNVTWNYFDARVYQLADMIRQSGWEFDKIVAIARGGLPLGTQLSHLLNKKLAVIFASSYTGENEQDRGEIQISIKIAMLTATLGKRILLVDDLVDSGVTLREVQKAIKDNNREVEEIRTAVLFEKTGSAITPCYCVERNIEKDRWIYLPYEKKPD